MEKLHKVFLGNGREGEEVLVMEHFTVVWLESCLYFLLWHQMVYLKVKVGSLLLSMRGIGRLLCRLWALLSLVGYNFVKF